MPVCGPSSLCTTRLLGSKSFIWGENVDKESQQFSLLIGCLNGGPVPAKAAGYLPKMYLGMYLHVPATNVEQCSYIRTVKYLPAHLHLHLTALV
jgi:hypothetical protein